MARAAAKKPSKKVEEARRARKDPDTVVSIRVGERLEKELKRRNLNLSRSESSVVALAVIIEFIQSRAHEWALATPIRGIGDPDAETVGIAEAILGEIAQKGMDLELPFDKAIGDWDGEEVAKFLAVGFLAIREQRAKTLERSGPRDYEAGSPGPQFTDDEIPF